MERPVRTAVVGLGENDLRRRDWEGVNFVQGGEGEGSYVCAVCDDDQVRLHLLAVE